MQSISEFVDSLSITSTHEHHLRFAPNEDCTLETIFGRSYVGWSGVALENQADRGRFLELMCGNSYFVWYEKALNALFDFGGEITVENWESISEKTREAYRTPQFHESVFKERCRFTRAILDDYTNPGGDNGRPDLYAPAFRVNSFLYGNHIECKDHNGNNAQTLYGECADLDEYLAMIERVIVNMKRKGCVALKSALAYDRPLDFKPWDKALAAKVFGKSAKSVAPDDLKAFGDFIFDYICTLAAAHNLPLQNHTGLGRLGGSNPMNLLPMIEKHPQTRFVLFHGGYPWIEEIAALSHNYANVYADLCWLPTICTSAAERLLHSLIEAARDSSRITWGGDALLVTESYGQALAARHVVSKVLTEKVVQGYLSDGRARMIAERIFTRNANELYGL